MPSTCSFFKILKNYYGRNGTNSNKLYLSDPFGEEDTLFIEHRSDYWNFFNLFFHFWKTAQI